MVVQIGINPITWTNDDVPELGGDTPLETCLEETALAGYAGTELGRKLPRTADALAPILEGFGLQLVSGWFDGEILDREIEEEFERIRSHLTLLRDLGCKVVVYADTSRGRHDGIFQPISKRPILSDEEWPAYGRKVTLLGERMADFGVAMAFHHHMGTIVETDREVDRLMASTGDAVGLLFDTGHCLFSGGDPLSLLRKHVARVNHVHCEDVRLPVLTTARSMDMSFMDAVLAGIFTVPGDGCIDFPSLLFELFEGNYAGWLVVEAEQDPNKATPLVYAELGYQRLREMVFKAGLRLA